MDAVHHRAVVVGGSAGAGLLRRQQRATLFTLRLSHVARVPLAKRRRSGGLQTLPRMFDRSIGSNEATAFGRIQPKSLVSDTQGGKDGWCG
jgi:hypothetical protein